MSKSMISSEMLISLSRDYVDDVMDGKKIIITKEHYYVFAISNFIATKEYFLKKKITGRISKVVFNINDSSNLLPMVVAFYNNVKSRNKSFKEPNLSEAISKIETDPGHLSDEEYLALYFFNDVRNSLAHPGNYIIKEENDERILCLDHSYFGTINIPIELFDFVAFYMNSQFENIDPVDTFENYMRYKKGSDNKKYYKFESKSAIKNTLDILAKTKMLIKQKELSLGRGRSLGQSRTDNSTISNREKYLESLVTDLISTYGDSANQIIKIIDDFWNEALINEKIFDRLLNLDIVFRVEKRLTSTKIDKSIKSIKSILRIDKKVAALYSHSVILFSNRQEPDKTNAQEVFSDVRKTERKLLAVEMGNINEMSNEEIKSILQQYKEVIEDLLKQLENLIRVNEHKYRNSIFHNNIDFDHSTEKIYFWDQKDNTVPHNGIISFEKTPKAYNLELKNIEDFNLDIGSITFMELFEILNQYRNEILEPNDFINKLFIINQVRNGLFKWDISINDFLSNIDEIIKELASGQK